MKYCFLVFIFFAMCTLTSCVNFQQTPDNNTSTPDIEISSDVPLRTTEAITPSPQTSETPEQAVIYPLMDNFIINAQTTPEITFGQKWDEGGYSICDFCIMPDNSLLLLESKSGRIFRFGNGELIKIYDFDLTPDYTPHKIACDDLGNIYLVAAKYNFLLKINSADEIHYSKLESFDLAGTTAFSVRSDGKVLVSLPDLSEDADKTFVIDISGESAVITETFIGYITNEYIFIPLHIQDPNDDKHMIGHRLLFQIYDFNLNNIVNLTVSSNNWILGGKCYGKAGDKYIAELVEVDDYDNFYNYLALIDSFGEITTRYNIPKGGTLKSFSGILYLFSQTDTELQINQAFSVLNSFE